MKIYYIANPIGELSDYIEAPAHLFRAVNNGGSKKIRNELVHIYGLPDNESFFFYSVNKESYMGIVHEGLAYGALGPEEYI